MAQAQEKKQGANTKQAQALVESVAEKIREFSGKGQLHFPRNYDPENALKAAWLKIQEAEDKQRRPALEVCTHRSIYNALLSMAVQGLNPVKDQCYFIVYGKKLVCMPSYFGKVAVAKRVDRRIADITAHVVYEDDEFEFEIRGSREYVTKHTRKLSNIDPDKITGAYAVVSYKDGTEFMEIMTIDEIHQAWKQGQLNPDAEGSTHQKFKQEMAKKTVISRATKRIIKTSDDSDIVVQYAQDADEDISDAEAQEQVDEEMGAVDVDLGDNSVEDEEPKEGPQEPQEGQEGQEGKADKKQGDAKNKKEPKQEEETQGEGEPQPELGF